LTLANEIRAFHLTEEDVKHCVEKIEKKYGDFSLPCDLSCYSDHADEATLNEINNLIHQGICSKELILKMATIANNLHPELITLFKRKKRYFYCACGAAAVIATASILAIVIGKQSALKQAIKMQGQTQNKAHNCETIQPVNKTVFSLENDILGINVNVSVNPVKQITNSNFEDIDMSTEYGTCLML
jgi:hypothetical protein